MTRREEIEKQAEITVFHWDEPQEQNKFQDGFIEGAKWADKTMIEKACEWITEHIDIPYEGRMIDGEPEAADYIKWAKERLKCAEEVAEAFRKAMEE